MEYDDSIESEKAMAGNNEILLTATKVDEWRRERDEIDLQIRELQQRRDEVGRKLEAVKILFPSADDSSTDADVELNGTVNDDESMVDAVYRILRESDKPLNHSEIKARLSESPKFKERLESAQNYYYTLMNRIVKKEAPERVVKTQSGYIIQRDNPLLKV